MINIFRNLDWSVMTDILVSIIPALLCITFHELSHGFVAYKLGDNTAKSMGRLTLNPIKHIDIMGLIMLVVFKFGWAKPVPVDMKKFKNPKVGMAITALAGPMSNFILAAVMFLLYGGLYIPLYETSVGYWVLQIFYTTAYISIALAIFNIIPIPPLDGSKVLFSCMSDSAYYKLMRYERYGMLLLIAIMFTDVLDKPISIAMSFMVNSMFPISEFAFNTVQKLFY